MKKIWLYLIITTVIVIIFSVVAVASSSQSNKGGGSGGDDHPLYKSSCFEESIDPGLPISKQKEYSFSVTGSDGKSYNTCLQIVNGGSQDMWINWLVGESPKTPSSRYPGNVGSADGIVASAWSNALSNPKAKSYNPGKNMWNWQNDVGHSEGMFLLPKGKYVLLPYMGTSVRIAGALGCSSTPKNGVDCQIARGGTPSPQTLVEWTWTPSGPDVIDSSFVDGYALPMRIQYLTEKESYKTILGKATKKDCSPSGKIIYDKDNKYLGCKSPCSSGINGVKGITNQTVLDQVCCAGTYNKPCTCHPCDGLSGTALKKCTSNDGGLCYKGIPVAKDILNPWCDKISDMFNVNGKRLGYCYAYDDDAGSIVDHNKYDSIVKVVFCTDGFDNFPTRI